MLALFVINAPGLRELGRRSSVGTGSCAFHPRRRENRGIQGCKARASLASPPLPVSPRPLAAIGCHVNGGWLRPGEAAGAVLSSQDRRPLLGCLPPSPVVGGGHAELGRKGLPAAAGLWR